jgi:hypothetical protein
LPRQARLDAPGTLHHVIVREIEKSRIVDDNKDRAEFVSRMGEVATEPVRLFMPGRCLATMPTFLCAAAIGKGTLVQT